MINTRTFIFFDFETGSKTPKTTQPLELAAVAINPRKLEIIEDNLFHSKIKPLSDEEAIAKGLDPVQKEALDVNKLTIEELQGWPLEQAVWENFVKWTYQWNFKKDSWGAPIAVHFNGTNFDMHIVDRLCRMYDPWDKKKEQQKIFNPIQQIDLKDLIFCFHENNPEIEGNSMAHVRDFHGYSTEGAHRADKDVMDGANTFCDYMKLIRHWSKRTDFKGRK